MIYRFIWEHFFRKIESDGMREKNKKEISMLVDYFLLLVGFHKLSFSSLFYDDYQNQGHANEGNLEM